MLPLYYPVTVPWLPKSVFWMDPCISVPLFPFHWGKDLDLLLELGSTGIWSLLDFYLHSWSLDVRSLLSLHCPCLTILSSLLSPAFLVSSGPVHCILSLSTIFSQHHEFRRLLGTVELQWIVSLWEDRDLLNTFISGNQDKDVSGFSVSSLVFLKNEITKPTWHYQRLLSAVRLL